MTGSGGDMQARSNFSQIAEAVLEQWPEHDEFLAKSFSSHQPDEMESLEPLAGDILLIAADKLDRFCESYRWMCAEFFKEELHFRRTGEYRCKTFEEAKSEVYDNREFMGKYMEGLLLSQLLWNNHAKSFLFFTNEFLPLLHEDYDYLEIGPGHGFFLAQAAQDTRHATLSAWDISAESLAQTRNALGRLGVADEVSLLQRDVLGDAAPEPTNAIVISEVLEHLETPEVALRNLRSCLRPSGLIFVNFPVNSPAPDHIFLLRHPDEVADMVEDAGFEILRLKSFPLTGVTLDDAIANRQTVSTVVIGQVPGETP
jgi:SAM-dependent methyltransferase